METCFQFGNKDGTDSLAYGIFYTIQGTYAIKWRFKEDSEDVKWEKVRIDGKSFECSFEFDDGIPKMWVKDSIRMDFPIIIHSHFCNLFRLSTDIRVSAYFDTMKEFPTIRRVHSLYIVSALGATGCMTKLHTLLSSIEISDHLEIRPYFKEPLSDDIQIWKIKSLCSPVAGLFTREHFLKFEGQNLNLTSYDISSEDIRTFIREWIEGKKFVRVESIFILSFRGGITENVTTAQLMEGIESKRFDPERRPSVLEFTDSMRRHFEGTSTKFRDALDIERKTDGRLATVECVDSTFHFFVWSEEVIRNYRQNIDVN
uniref:FBA_2 domain-containing protein n=1 Tax=Caenorhabditis tropicalis TaxID=1561998 RepID=A0A1I7TEG8_9PELO